jgi:hypothetical protein
MTTKTVPPRRAETRETLPDGLRTAYQAHTLAQLLTQRLAAAPSWVPMVQDPYPPALH